MLSRVRSRAVAVVAGLWAGAWAVATPLMLAIVLLVVPQLRALFMRGGLAGGLALGAGALLFGTIAMAVKGALTGAAFALLLSRMERGRRVDDLSAWRILLWSNAAGAFWSALNFGLARALDPSVSVRWWQVAASVIGHGGLVTASALATVWLLRRGAGAGDGRPGARVAAALGAPAPVIDPLAPRPAREPAV